VGWGGVGGKDGGLQLAHRSKPSTPPPDRPNHTFISYIKERDLDWSYWPLDGQQGPSRTLGAEETYGLLNTAWNGYAYKPLLEQLWSLM